VRSSLDAVVRVREGSLDIDQTRQERIRFGKTCRGALEPTLLQVSQAGLPDGVELAGGRPCDLRSSEEFIDVTSGDEEVEPLDHAVTRSRERERSEDADHRAMGTYCRATAVTRSGGGIGLNYILAERVLLEPRDAARGYRGFQPRGLVQEPIAQDQPREAEDVNRLSDLGVVLVR